VNAKDKQVGITKQKEEAEVPLRPYRKTSRHHTFNCSHANTPHQSNHPTSHTSNTQYLGITSFSDHLNFPCVEVAVGKSDVVCVESRSLNGFTGLACTLSSRPTFLNISGVGPRIPMNMSMLSPGDGLTLARCGEVTECGISSLGPGFSEIEALV